MAHDSYESDKLISGIDLLIVETIIENLYGQCSEPLHELNMAFLEFELVERTIAKIESTQTEIGFSRKRSEAHMKKIGDYVEVTVKLTYNEGHRRNPTRVSVPLNRLLKTLPNDEQIHDNTERVIG